jgi:hypothetical protein
LMGSAGVSLRSSCHAHVNQEVSTGEKCLPRLRNLKLEKEKREGARNREHWCYIGAWTVPCLRS